MGSRGVSPVVGVASIALLTVGAALLVGTAVFGFAGSVPDAPPQASIGVEVEGNAVELLHRGGDPLEVTAIRVRISVDGTPLEHQPTVPNAGITGFVDVPRGPFNSGSADTTWEAGEIAGLEIATTNAPQPSPGDRIVVRIAVDGHVVAVASATVS